MPVSRLLTLGNHHPLVSADDEHVLLDVERRCYYALNPVAFFVLSLAETGCSFDQVPRRIAARFEVDERAAAADLARFVKDAAALGVIIVQEGEAHDPLVPIEPVRVSYEAPALHVESEIPTVMAALTATVSID